MAIWQYGRPNLFNHFTAKGPLDGFPILFQYIFTMRETDQSSVIHLTLSVYLNHLTAFGILWTFWTRWSHWILNIWNQAILKSLKLLQAVQGWAKRWTLGCVNHASCHSLAMGRRFTQPRAYLLADPCICKCYHNWTEHQIRMETKYEMQKMSHNFSKGPAELPDSELIQERTLRHYQILAIVCHWIALVLGVNSIEKILALV